MLGCWDASRCAYTCRDGAKVEVKHTAFWQHTLEEESEWSDQEDSESDEESVQEYVVPRNGISLKARGEDCYSPQVFVSEMGFSRDMSKITSGSNEIKTITLPNTVRHVMDDTFSHTPLESVILNEGLEVLGGCNDSDNSYHSGVFSYTKLRQVIVPTTLRTLGDNAFRACPQLAHVIFRIGSRLEKVGNFCFSYSSLEEFQTPLCLK